MLDIREILRRLQLGERERRGQKPIRLRLRRATLDLEKTLEGFDFAFNPSINRGRIFDLATCHFVERRENVLIQGPAGVVKSHLAQAPHLAVAFRLLCHPADRLDLEGDFPRRGQRGNRAPAASEKRRENSG